MGRLELVAGTFGTGTARYAAGEFRLPKGRLQNIANVTAVEANATIVEKHWGRAIMSGARSAAGLAPLAMVIGVFAAPLAVVGTIGIAAAAIGGAAGLIGGGAETKALMQVAFDQGTGFIAVCEQELARAIENDLILVRAQAERERKRLELPKRGWFAAKPAPSAIPPQAALPAPEVEATSIFQTVGEHVGEAASATGAAAVAAAEATGQALSGAFAYARRAVHLDK